MFLSPFGHYCEYASIVGSRQCRRRHRGRRTQAVSTTHSTLLFPCAPAQSRWMANRPHRPSHERNWKKKKKIALKRMPNKKMGFIFIYLAALMDLDGAAAFFLRFIFFLCSRALDATIIYSYRHFFIVLTRISFGFICCVGKIERMKKVFSHVRQPRHRAPSSDLLHFLFCSTILCFPLSIQLSSGECTWCLAASWILSLAFWANDTLIHRRPVQDSTLSLPMWVWCLVWLCASLNWNSLFGHFEWHTINDYLVAEHLRGVRYELRLFVCAWK